MDTLKHYIVIPVQAGYAVAYGNHRGEFIPVMECGTFDSAYRESARMTLDEIHQAAAAVNAVQGGNAYLQAYMKRGRE